MVRDVEEEDLRRADGEEEDEALVPGLPVDPGLDRPPDRAEAPEGHDGDGPRQRLVAGGQRVGPAELLQHVVEGDAALEGFHDRRVGEAAGGEAAFIRLCGGLLV